MNENHDSAFSETLFISLNTRVGILIIVKMLHRCHEVESGKQFTPQVWHIHYIPYFRANVLSPQTWHACVVTGRTNPCFSCLSIVRNNSSMRSTIARFWNTTCNQHWGRNDDTCFIILIFLYNNSPSHACKLCLTLCVGYAEPSTISPWRKFMWLWSHPQYHPISTKWLDQRWIIVG